MLEPAPAPDPGPTAHELLRRRYPIAGITGHSDIAPGRKSDPGPAFDWARLERLIATRSRNATAGSLRRPA